LCLVREEVRDPVADGLERGLFVGREERVEREEVVVCAGRRDGGQ
jgi:hypothetical protein